jgi:hypothetical protein
MGHDLDQQSLAGPVQRSAIQISKELMTPFSPFPSNVLGCTNLPDPVQVYRIPDVEKKKSEIIVTRFADGTPRKRRSDSECGASVFFRLPVEPGARRATLAAKQLVTFCQSISCSETW